MADEKEERKKGQNGDFCSGISRKVRRTSRVASQYTSEADMLDSL